MKRFLAFIVGLPVSDPSGDAEPTLPARFELRRTGPTWVVYSDPRPRMVPKVPPAYVGRSPRRVDARSYLELHPLAVHVPSSRGAFLAGSSDVRFLRTAYDKANAQGYATWTIAEFRADTGAQAEWLRGEIQDSEPRFRRIAAGFDREAMETTTRAEIDAASPLPE